MNHNTRRPVRLFALTLILSVLLTAAAPGTLAAEDGRAVIAKTVSAGETAAFTEADFSPLTESGELSLIRIVSLPESAAGVLKLGVFDLSAGDEIGAGALTGLCFTAAEGVSGGAAFGIAPVYAGGREEETVTVSLRLTASENLCPIAENLQLKTYRNVAVAGTFQATDPEGDALTFEIAAGPGKGEVRLERDGFVYTPGKDERGKDSFSYVAVDSAGNVSQPATVTVTIDRKSTKVVYSDMAERPEGNYAALRLAEEGVLTGESIGGEWFFHPDDCLSRGEFLALCLSVADIQGLEGISRTGFADDGEMPLWVKPYVSAALMTGVVRGYTTESGALVFSSEREVSCAEALVMLDNVLHISNVPQSMYPEEGSAPVWAVQASANLSSCDIVASGSVIASDPLTREQAAELLVGAIELLATRSDKSDGGLFSWVW